MLTSKDLTFAYPGQAVLRFPDIGCQRGESQLILGQSGSGKTTLLHLLGGLRTAQGGSVRIDDTELQQLRGSELDRFRGRHIGIVFQQTHFVRSLRVLDNLLLAQSLAGIRPDARRCQGLLERLNLPHKASARPENLSLGEQQRVAIARALVNQPGLILADDPTSALDDANCEEVLQLLEAQAREENAALLIVTHDGRLKERFDQIIILS